jgi:hypothetical protein
MSVGIVIVLAPRRELRRHRLELDTSIYRVFRGG